MRQPGRAHQAYCPARPELPVLPRGTCSVSTMRRRVAVVHARLAFGPAMILALGALLASAFLSDGFARELPSGSLWLTPHAERLADQALRPSAPSSDAERPALVRSTVPAIARLKSPQGGGTDGQRSPDVAVTPVEQLALAALRTPGEAVEARRYGVRSPGQPAPSSRAPPIG